MPFDTGQAAIEGCIGEAYDLGRMAGICRQGEEAPALMWTHKDPSGLLGRTHLGGAGSWEFVGGGGKFRGGADVPRHREGEVGGKVEKTIPLQMRVFGVLIILAGCAENRTIKYWIQDAVIYGMGGRE